MGHAGATISGGKGGAEDKIAAMEALALLLHFGCNSPLRDGCASCWGLPKNAGGCSSPATQEKALKFTKKKVPEGGILPAWLVRAEK